MTHPVPYGIGDQPRDSLCPFTTASRATRQGQALNRETPGTIEAAVQRVLKTTTRDNLDVTRAVLSKLARELDGGGRSRVSGMRR